jgi:hypothetical protein
MAWVGAIGVTPKQKEQEDFLLTYGSKADKKRIKAVRAQRAAKIAEKRAARAAKKRG